MAGVLDAMFEKTVQAGEFIIRQGDDGDNFYVIEKYVYVSLDKALLFFFFLSFFDARDCSFITTKLARLLGGHLFA
jgi:hypothetical protein